MVSGRSFVLRGLTGPASKRTTHMKPCSDRLRSPEYRRHDEADCGDAHRDRRRPPDDIQKATFGPLSHRRAVVRDDHYQEHKWHRDETVDHRAQDEGGDRVDVEDGDDHPNERRGDDDRVELRSSGDLAFEPRSPAERLGYAVGGGARQDGYGQHAGPDESQGEQERCLLYTSPS